MTHQETFHALRIQIDGETLKYCKVHVILALCLRFSLHTSHNKTFKLI